MLNPLSQANLADPYPLYDRLRSTGDAVCIEGGSYAVTGYEAVCSVLSDTKSFTADVRQWVTPALLGTDPPHHREERRSVHPSFSQARFHQYIELIEPEIEASIQRLRQGPCDFMEAFAHAVPFGLLSEILLVTSEERAQFKKWIRLVELALMAIDGQRMSRDTFQEATHRMDAFFRRKIQALDPKAPPEAWRLYSFLHPDLGPGRTEHVDLCVNLCRTLMLAAVTTVAASLANALLALHRSPGLLGILQADRKLIGPFLNESLRFEAPLQLAIPGCRRGVWF